MNLDEVNNRAYRIAMLIAAHSNDKDEINQVAVMFKLLGNALTEKAVLQTQLNSDDLTDCQKKHQI